MPASQITAPGIKSWLLCFLSSSLLMYTWETAGGGSWHWVLGSTWETWTKFLLPGLALAQLQNEDRPLSLTAFQINKTGARLWHLPLKIQPFWSYRLLHKSQLLGLTHKKWKNKMSHTWRFSLLSKTLPNAFFWHFTATLKSTVFSPYSRENNG